MKFFKQSSDIDQSTVTVLVHAILRLFSSTFSCLMFKMPFLEEHLEGVGMRVGRKQRPKTQKQRGPPPKKKSLINSKKRLSQAEVCKKQQDLHLPINLTRVFVSIFYTPTPLYPNIENKDPPKKHLKMASNSF